MGSQGLLYLDAAIVCFVGPGQLITADANGLAELPLDPANLPTGLDTGVWGDRLYFQARLRDTVPTLTSNLTSAVAVMIY